MRLLGRLRRRRLAPGGVADLRRHVEEVGYAALSWSCMVCGKTRPHAEIGVESATNGWLTVNTRYCLDSDECKAEAARLSCEAVQPVKVPLAPFDPTDMYGTGLPKPVTKKLGGDR